LERIKVGVVGTGKLGRLHALRYKEIAAADLVGVYDVDGARMKAVAAEAGCRAFPDLTRLLDQVDAVNVVVPTTHHFAVAREALRRKKHVFIEKPITTTLEEADELIRLARHHRRIIQVGHIERFNQAMRAVQAIELHPGFIESHRLAMFDPRGTDVAVVLDLMIHDIDIILSLVKSPVQHIDANGVAVISDEPDIANARLTFANGCVANVTASRISQKKMRKMRLFQKDAYVSIDFLQGISERYRLVQELPTAEASNRASGPQSGIVMGKLEGKHTRYIVYERLQAPEGNALKMELEAFVRAIQTGKAPEVGAEDGRKALEVASKISEIIKRQELADGHPRTGI